MRTYAYVRIRPRGKCVESTCVRTRTYVFGRMENAWSPRTYAYVRTRPRGVRRDAFVEIRPFPTSRVGSTHCVILTLDVRGKLLICLKLMLKNLSNYMMKWIGVKSKFK